MVKYFKNKRGDDLALLIRDDAYEDGISFFTKDDDSLQVAKMCHRAGHIIKNHYHNKVPRIVNYTKEVIIVKSGSIEVFLFDAMEMEYDFKISSGDILILLSGGHGFKILEDSIFYEVKQGPYIGENDKTRF